MNTIFDALRNDHQTQRSLIDAMVETEGDTEERRGIFEQLSAQLRAHAAAEERYFYVPLMEVDLTQDNARHSVAEHKELDDYVEKLEEYDMGGSQWLQTARELRDRLTHHLDEEEVEVFPVAGRALTEDQKVELATDYTSDMERHLAQG